MSALPETLPATRPAVPGLGWSASHRAELALEGATVEVGLERGHLHLRRPTEALPAEAALLLSSGLPGNARIAGDARTQHLRADLWPDEPRRLSAALHAQARALDRASRPRRGVARGLLDSQRRARLEALVRGLEGKHSIGVVERPGGWELRPRVGGQAMAVQAALATGGLHLSRVLLELDEQGPTRAAACDQALRWNERLAFARLALVGSTLVAETRIERLPLETELAAQRLAASARAIVFSSARASRLIGALASQPTLARIYASFFLTPSTTPNEDPSCSTPPS